MKHDLVADMFCCIKNAENMGKKECIVPASKVIESILKIIQKHKYIGEFVKIKDDRGSVINVKLVGNINNCNVIKPRFAAKSNELLKWEKKFLPANNVGIIILTTSKGIIDQNESKERGIGGKLLGYVY